MVRCVCSDNKRQGSHRGQYSGADNKKRHRALIEASIQITRRDTGLS